MTTSAPTPRLPRLRSALQWLWPPALAAGMTALTLSDESSAEEVTALAEALLLLPLLYLVVAGLGRREASWPVLVILVVPFVALRALDVVAPATAISAVAAIVLVWGAVAGRLHRPGAFRVQALGMIGFGALALAGLVLAPEPAVYAVAAGWFLHGVWDLVHLIRGTVVSRSYALWCGVLDILIAAELLFLG